METMQKLLTSYQEDEIRFIGKNQVEFRVFPKEKRYQKCTINEDATLNILEDVQSDSVNAFDFFNYLLKSIEL